ncbi:MAG TPA: hypothetical protein VLT47_12235 [Anaeromyxobacteraceae bacterium]|nr:hypothetical protein [Anaeromyxobacteraceae bacterium]
MAAPVAQFSVHEGGSAVRSDEHRREIHELWFTLARRPWQSLVLVPTDVGMSVAAYATALAEVGTRLRDSPVTAIDAENMSYESARKLTNVHALIADGGHRWLLGSIEAEAKVTLAPREVVGEGSVPHAAPRPMSPFGQVVIAIRSVFEQPLGVAVAQAADAVVICVEMGQSRLKSARRTLQLVGPERVVGTLLLRE